jgi:hypothetical protein
LLPRLNMSRRISEWSTLSRQREIHSHSISFIEFHFVSKDNNCTPFTEDIYEAGSFAVSVSISPAFHFRWIGSSKFCDNSFRLQTVTKLIVNACVLFLMKNTSL